jgi:hypothetical protein
MPHSATPYAKMAYASGKGMLRDGLDGVLDTSCAQLDGLEEAFGMSDGPDAKGDDDDEDPADW